MAKSISVDMLSKKGFLGCYTIVLAYRAKTIVLYTLKIMTREILSRIGYQNMTMSVKMSHKWLKSIPYGRASRACNVRTG